MRPRQIALQCEGCDRWQHRKCNSGITQNQYCQAVHNKSEIDWKCADCSAQLHSFHWIIPDPNITANVSAFLPPADSTHEDVPPSPHSSTTDSSIASLAELMATDTSLPSEFFNADTSNFSMPSFNSANSSDSDIDDVTLPSFNVPEYSMENSIDESLPTGAIAADPPPVEYKVIPASSERGHDKLTDSLGFSYGVKKSNGKRTLWQCSIHNDHVYCHATVHQEGIIFTPVAQPHIHPGKPGIANSLQTRKKINKHPLAEIFTSAAEITEQVLSENAPNEPTPGLPSNIQLAQNAS